ncbi:MAG: hypothetical protein JNG88_13210 [Phycisphaerales bacterium]|nr:hypothetical protein [Phycisphaerales bacterium]
MNAGLRTLLNGILDYAGLFPPASLALDAAARNYAAYLAGADRWMLSRFICPTAALGDLSKFVSLFEAEPLRLSALGRGAETTSAFLNNLRDDLAAMRSFADAHGERVAIENFEMRMPADSIHGDCTGPLVQLLDDARAAFATAGFAHVSAACEATVNRDDIRDVDNFIGAIAFFNSKLTLEKRGGPADRFTFKLRCGGVRPDAFPTVELVSRALSRCGESGVPIKFTAGLHHPFPRFDAAAGARMYGFIPMYLAAILAHMYQLSEAEIAAVLTCDDPAHFEITDSYLRFGDHAVPNEEIESLRQNYILTFGSCSFDEPRDDLRAAGLW